MSSAPGPSSQQPAHKPVVWSKRGTSRHEARPGRAGSRPCTGWIHTCSLHHTDPRIAQ
ncbi:hypothetical protein JYU34_009808 [Plutella xylostella]|uniref:Uncharacterized protein n=1 Tax=Plutella xylostella TaxID=51655 RepID=A0ABQ7QKV8_PLUXY|nr:hypothetical protein JYU34_009808 [Plutella xylostella]